MNKIIKYTELGYILLSMIYLLYKLNTNATEYELLVISMSVAFTMVGINLSNIIFLDFDYK